MKAITLKGLCRVFAAVILLGVGLAAFDGYTAIEIAGRSVSFLTAALLAGFTLDGEKIKPPLKPTVTAVCSVMLLSIALSFVLPSKRGELGVGEMLNAVLLAPVLEEIFFRAALKALPFFELLSAAIFAVFHGGSIFQAFVIGFVIALFYKKTGSISTAVICHFCNNLLAVICIFYDVRLPMLALSLLTVLILWRTDEKKVL